MTKQTQTPGTCTTDNQKHQQKTISTTSSSSSTSMKRPHSDTTDSTATSSVDENPTDDPSTTACPSKKTRVFPRVVVYDFSDGSSHGASGFVSHLSSSDNNRTEDGRTESSRCDDNAAGGGAYSKHSMKHTSSSTDGQAPKASAPPPPFEPPTPPTSPVNTNTTEDVSSSSSSSSQVSVSPEKRFCEIQQPVETIDDLISVGRLYDEVDYNTKTYSVNVAGLNRMIPALQEFQSMIGMDSIKKQVVDQIIYLSGSKNHSQFSQQMNPPTEQSTEGAPSTVCNSTNNKRDQKSKGTGNNKNGDGAAPHQRSPLALPPSTTTDAPRITHIRPLTQRRSGHTPLRSVRSTNNANGTNNCTPPPSILSQLFSGLADAQQKRRGRSGVTGPSQQFRTSESVTRTDTAHDMFHTVIYGPPGVGKTAFAKILARLFMNLGITQNDTFRVARRSDLIGEYVGHTATKTQKVIDEAMGGVLFIDEVYALGNGAGENKHPASKSDSFSTECINTLNQNLTERKGEFVCIIAGYKKETEKQFFNLNPGLRRRFSFQYTIDAYDWKELTRILLYKIEQLVGWDCVANLGKQLLEDTSFLKAHMGSFPHYAGDVETWLLHVKIAHCKRVFGKHESVQRMITFADVEAGLERYKIQKRDVEKENELGRAASMNHLYM